MRVTTADRLKQLMDERHLRQVDIIKLCEPYCTTVEVKLSKSDLSQFVNGKVVPGQWKLSILGRALNVSEAWLMGYDVPRERISDEQQAINDSAIVGLQQDQSYHYLVTLKEQELVDLYRRLSDAGQDQLTSYARFLTTQEGMKKDTDEKAVS